MSKEIGEVSELPFAISVSFLCHPFLQPLQSCLGLAQRSKKMEKSRNNFMEKKSAFPCQPLLWGASQELAGAGGVTSDKLSQVLGILGRCFFKELMETLIP